MEDTKRRQKEINEEIKKKREEQIMPKKKLAHGERREKEQNGRKDQRKADEDSVGGPSMTEPHQE